jgi:hypothetical protein
MGIDRAVRECDFRRPEFRDADPKDYEFRDDGKIVRKDRWEMGIRKIVSRLGMSRGDFEIDDVADAVSALKVPKLMTASDWDEEFGDVLMFHFESFNEAPEIQCATYGQIPAIDTDYWTHFARYDINAILSQAEAAQPPAQEPHP